MKVEFYIFNCGHIEVGPEGRYVTWRFGSPCLDCPKEEYSIVEEPS